MTNWTCRDGGRCGIGGYCDDCWNIEKYSEKDLIDEKLKLLDELLNRISAAPMDIYEAICKLKSEIENE